MSGIIENSYRKDFRVNKKDIHVEFDRKARAVEIVSINDGKFELNEQNLKDILSNESSKNKPVIFVL